MRTTLDIDDDVLNAAKEIAAKERKTAGKVLSDLFRIGIRNRQTPPPVETGTTLRNGVPVVPSRGEVVTTEHIRELMEREGI